MQQSYDPDALASGYTGVQTFARASISSLAPTQLARNGTTYYSTAFYTASGPASGFDKRAATALTCSLDIVSMLAFMVGIHRFGQLQKRIQIAEDVRAAGHAHIPF